MQMRMPRLHTLSIVESATDRLFFKVVASVVVAGRVEWSSYPRDFVCKHVRANELWPPWPGGRLVQVAALASFTCISVRND